MIDKCEAVFFLNTDNSLKSKNITHSPWIYQELLISKLIKRKQYRDVVSMERFNEKYENQLKIEYALDLEHLTKLNESDLRTWKNLHNSEHSLDALYRKHPLTILTDC